MKTFIRFVSAAFVALALASCSKDGMGTKYFDATGTFKIAKDGTYYVRVEDDLALRVSNGVLNKYPFSHGKEQRAIFSYYIDEEYDAKPVEGFKETIGARIINLDTIRTKKPIAYVPKLDKTYGNDPIALFLGPEAFPRTIVEDGYLSVSFSLPLAVPGAVIHEVNLLTGVNPDDPYEVELRHKANGDIGPFNTSYICDFILKDLPSTEGKTVKLTLKWESSVSGKMESVKFDYKSREDWD